MNQCQWCETREIDDQGRSQEYGLCIHCLYIMDKMNDVIQESDHRNLDERNGAAWAMNRLKEKLRRTTNAFQQGISYGLNWPW